MYSETLNQVKRLILVILTFIITSCAQNPFEPVRGQVALNSGYEAIQDGIDTNEKAQVSTVPLEVNHALLPELTLQPKKEIPRNKRFDIAVNNLDAKAFFMGLVKDTHYNMVVSPNIEGSITLDLKNVTIEGVLNAVRDMYGFEYEVTPYGFQITADGLKTRLFSVDYLNLERITESEIQISSGQITQNSQDTTSNPYSGTSTLTQTSNVNPAARIKTKNTNSFWTTLQLTLEAMLHGKPERRIVLNPNAGLVMVHASASELDQIAQYLDQMQTSMTRQVILEAKILEVTLNDAYQQGIDWKVLGAVQMGTQDLVNPADVTIQDTLEGFSDIFKLTATGGSQFSTVIELLTAQGNVQTLSSPRISTLNHQKAVIKVGYDEFFITNVSNTSTTSGSAADNTQNIDLTPFFSGIALDVTPQINANGNVILHIHPLISTVTDQNKAFIVSGLAQELPLAFSVIRESDSIVEAKSGQVIVIGGLMKDNTEEYVGATPFLNRVPFLGNFFRKTNQKSQKTELVILLKATVVERGTWAKSLKNEMNRYHDLDRGYYFGDIYEMMGNMGEFRAYDY